MSDTQLVAALLDHAPTAALALLVAWELRAIRQALAGLTGEIRGALGMLARLADREKRS